MTAGPTASGWLYELLDRPGPYRSTWEQHSRRGSRHGVSHAAVARVLAQHLWDSGEADEADADLPRRLKDRVARALRGEQLSAETVGWLTAAFRLSPADAERLQRLALAPDEPTVVVGRRSARPPQLPQSRHRTVALHELHVLGPDGRPAEHRTVHVIQALQDGVDTYVHRFDTDEVHLRVLRGGTAGPIRPAENGLWAVDIELTRALARGETASLEYHASFAYGRAPEPVCRRAALTRVDSLELRVQFHPDRLPARVEWAQWPALEGPPDLLEPVQLDREHSAHRFLRMAVNTVVGFHWQW